MTENTVSTPPSYGRALLDTLTELGPGDLTLRLTCGAALAALVAVIHHTDPVWGGVFLGLAVAAAWSSVTEVLALAAARRRHPDLWYAPGRRVFALNLGTCEVLDYDDRPELQTVWVLLLPLDDDTAVWTELDPRHIASTGRELAERRAQEEEF